MVAKNIDKRKKAKILFKTSEALWSRVQLYKIHAHCRHLNDALEELIALGWEKYKEEKDKEGVFYNGRRKRN